MKKILFLHGFYASGSCVPALALREAFEGKATVLTPDLPLHPADAIKLIREICESEKPDIIVGNRQLWLILRSDDITHRRCAGTSW